MNTIMNTIPIMRAKLKIDNIEKQPEYPSERITFSAVSKPAGYPVDGSDEDNSFALWTPLANLTMSITNPSLHNKFEVGQKFYVDFTLAN